MLIRGPKFPFRKRTSVVRRRFLGSTSEVLLIADLFQDCFHARYFRLSVVQVKMEFGDVTQPNGFGNGGSKPWRFGLYFFERSLGRPGAMRVTYGTPQQNRRFLRELGELLA